MLRRPSALFLGAAWICYVISFFLPAVGGWGAMQGWGAALTCGQILVEPGGVSNLGGWLYYGFFTFANLLMVISPWLWIRSWRRQNRMKWFRITSILLVLYVVSVDVIFRDGGGSDLYSGYFLWTVSFMLLAGGWHVNAKEIELGGVRFSQRIFSHG
jgi:hypothetical protein